MFRIYVISVRSRAGYRDAISYLELKYGSWKYPIPWKDDIKNVVTVFRLQMFISNKIEELAEHLVAVCIGVEYLRTNAILSVIFACSLYLLMTWFQSWRKQVPQARLWIYLFRSKSLEYTCQSWTCSIVRLMSSVASSVALNLPWKDTRWWAWPYA